MSELGKENLDSFLKGDFLIMGWEISTTRDESGVEGIVPLRSRLASRDGVRVGRPLRMGVADLWRFAGGGTVVT